MNKPTLASLRNAYAGRAAAVLGGGPSLPNDFARVPAGALLIGVNHHALFVGIKPDMMVFSDAPEHFPNLMRGLASFDGLKISPYQEEWSDFHVGDDFWRGPGSGIFGAWLACFMGCDPVLLCGMDLYQGRKRYCHGEENAYKHIYSLKLDEHLRRWQAGQAPGVCPGYERIRAVSGPLVKVFGEWNNAN